MMSHCFALTDPSLSIVVAYCWSITPAINHWQASLTLNSPSINHELLLIIPSDWFIESIPLWTPYYHPLSMVIIPYDVLVRMNDPPALPIDQRETTMARPQVLAVPTRRRCLRTRAWSAASPKSWTWMLGLRSCDDMADGWWVALW